MLMIPESYVFDQQTMTRMLWHDPLVQRYRTFFDQLDWSVVPDPPVDPSRPGRRPHPKSAYIKALLIKICEGFEHISQLRRFLLRHPLLVLAHRLPTNLQLATALRFSDRANGANRSSTWRLPTGFGSSDPARPVCRHGQRTEKGTAGFRRNSGI